MGCEVRNFSEFNNFPGELIQDVHTFPKLWQKDKLEHWRNWQIFIRMIKTPNELINSIDWDIFKENQIPIKKDYYKMGTKIDTDNVAEVWVETGIDGGKITHTAPTYFAEPLNKGKTNERNVLQNALIYARSQWLKKKEKGASESKYHKTKTNLMYFPMLSKSFKDAEKNLVFPLFIQPKLDGVRCIVFLKEKNNPKSVIAYSRNKKLFPGIEYIKKRLYPYLNMLYDEEKKQSIYFDGELYKHGKKLQDISGDSRNAISDETNEYHIYDCFYPLDHDPFEKRYRQLEVFYEAINSKDKSVLKSVPTYLIKNMDEANKFYKKFVKMGYEGAMLRNKNGLYLTDPHKTGTFLRSNDLVKMKPKFTDEYEVIGFTDGSKGKDKGAIIWICQTENKETFNVTPKDMDYTERYKLFEDAKKNFDKKYKNRMLTVEYEDLSKNGVPLRAKSLTFRDYE